MTAAAKGFHHEALLYAGPSAFLRATVPFVRRATGAGEPVLVAVGPDKIDRLRRELGAAAAAVEFADMDGLGRNPACIIPAWQDFVERHGGHLRLWGIGEPMWPGRDHEEVVECQAHEALLNLAFDGGPALSLLCPYDVSRLPRIVVRDAGRSHPWIRWDGRSRLSARYEAGAVVDEHLTRPLPPPTCDVRQRCFDLGSLRRVRELVRDHAGPVLGPARTDDLVLAASEIAANSVRHGGGAGVVRVWHDARGIGCEVSDVGRFDEPLAGRRRPEPVQSGGRGLWIVNQLCDLVQVRTHGGGSTVRVHMARPSA